MASLFVACTSWVDPKGVNALLVGHPQWGILTSGLYEVYIILVGWPYAHKRASHGSSTRRRHSKILAFLESACYSLVLMIWLSLNTAFSWVTHENEAFKNLSFLHNICYSLVLKGTLTFLFNANTSLSWVTHEKETCLTCPFFFTVSLSWMIRFLTFSGFIGPYYFGARFETILGLSSPWVIV